METTAPPPWLDPEAETVPTFEPSGMRHRTDEAARTARRLTLVQVAAALVVTLAVLALVGLGVTYMELVPRFKAAQWELDRYPGRVLSVTKDGDDESDAGTVDVRYGPDIDHLHRATVAVGDVDRYRVGQSVTTLVDREAGTVTLPGENFTPEWFETLAAAVIVAALGLGALGIWTIARLNPIARALSRTPWRPERACWGVAPIGEPRTQRGVVYLPDVATDLVWTTSIPVMAFGQVDDDRWRTLEVAGDRTGLAVRRPQGGRVVSARPHPWPVVAS